MARRAAAEPSCVYVRSGVRETTLTFSVSRGRYPHSENQQVRLVDTHIQKVVDFHTLSFFPFGRTT